MNNIFKDFLMSSYFSKSKNLLKDLSLIKTRDLKIIQVLRDSTNDVLLKKSGKK